MIGLLQRMAAAVSYQPQASFSEQAVQDVGRELVAWAMETQNRSAGTTIAPSSGSDAVPPAPPQIPVQELNAAPLPEEMQGISLLPENEQAIALQQRTCPVNGEPLGSMGKPVRVDVSARSIYVCCEGCVNAVHRNPDRYLP